MHSLGIDIGGTFTDLVLMDDARGTVRTHKLLTTPGDPVRAVVEGVRALLDATPGSPLSGGPATGGTRGPGIRPSVSRVVHGTTLVTNAVVERKGAVTALLTTRGFRDVLEIRREGRYDLYDLDLEFPEPLVPRRRRFEAEERLDETGRVLTPLDQEALGRLLDSLGDTGIESWAVCFLHAYANGHHERRAEALLRARFPGTPVSLSSEVAPEIREYERTSTVVANAYVRPVAEGYLRRLARGLGEVLTGGAGIDAEEAACGEPPLASGTAPVLHIMLSDGGITSPEVAGAHPIRIVESGPAGGVLAAARLGAGLGHSRMISLDMGGTTAKIAFLDERGPRIQSLFEVDRRHFYRKGSGMPVLAPSIDLVEIGAGGGSRAARGPLGTLVVGPESAGADPGPAAYGRGGRHATVTDADLVLGLLDPDYFLGGRMALDAAAAREAVMRDVGQPLGLDLVTAAHGVFVTVGSNMAEAARVYAAERGLDPAAHALVAFGGAGPVHAWSVARQLRIPRVVYPGHAGVESALGFLAAPPAFECVRSGTEALEDLDVARGRERLADLAAEARAVVETAGAGPIALQASVDMRYRGQGAEVRVPLPDLSVDRQALAAAFLAAYRELYGREVTGIPLEVVTWRVRAERPAAAVAVFDAVGEAGKASPLPEPHALRTAWLPDIDAPGPVPVYRRDTLPEGACIPGPALVEEEQTTVVLGRGVTRVLRGGALLAELGPATAMGHEAPATPKGEAP